MAAAQVWYNCSDNSCRIIRLSRRHIEISARSQIPFSDYWYQSHKKDQICLQAHGRPMLVLCGLDVRRKAKSYKKG